ncbi:MAG: outer membrane beta-barrel protein [Bacteroidales bacterium]|nr:outer membrane beta-barrel protein [Bacteroidales bacterium]
MTDKNWNDNLRQRMSEYTENPPEGLWEALKAAGAVGAEEAAGADAVGRRGVMAAGGLADAAGSSGLAGEVGRARAVDGLEAAGAAGSGLFARLFGRRTAPVWWSLAGVAAAVAAVLILRVPGGSVKVNPADAIIVDSPGAVAQTEIPEAVSTPNPSLVQTTPVSSGKSSSDVASTGSRVQTTPVLPPAGGKSSTSGANHPGFAPGSSNRGAVTPVSSGNSSSDVASTDVPAGNGSAASSSDLSTAVSTSVISTEAQRSGEISSSPSSDAPAVSTSDVSTAVSSSVISTEAERSGEISSSDQDQNATVSIPDTTEQAPFGSNQSGFDPESVSRPVKRDRPLIAATLVGAGMPGGTSVTNTINYGLRTGNLRMGATPREATMLSRNRVTETSITRRLDFQLGLMVSFDITRHWGIETGLLYTRLASTATSISGQITSTSEDRLNYLGLPVHVIYTPVQLRLLSIYFSAGPELEYGIARNWRVYDMIDSGITASDRGTDFLGDFILSASLNAGIQIHPTRHGAFFLQPGVVFRHVWDTTLESYYTDHPVSFRLSAGYRITF